MPVGIIHGGSGQVYHWLSILLDGAMPDFTVVTAVVYECGIFSLPFVSLLLFLYIQIF